MDYAMGEREERGEGLDGSMLMSRIPGENHTPYQSHSLSVQPSFSPPLSGPHANRFYRLFKQTESVDGQLKKMGYKATEGVLFCHLCIQKP